jgi:hypothetical protein
MSRPRPAVFTFDQTRFFPVNLNRPLFNQVDIIDDNSFDTRQYPNPFPSLSNKNRTLVTRFNALVPDYGYYSGLRLMLCREHDCFYARQTLQPHFNVSSSEVDHSKAPTS